MRYKIIYSDAIAATSRPEIAGADIAHGDPASAQKREGSESRSPRAKMDVVSWPTGYVSEMRASLNLIESHLELLLHGSAPLIAEYMHAYLRKIQRAADQVRILVQAQISLATNDTPDGSKARTDDLPAGSLSEICASLDAIERDVEFFLHGHLTLLAEHRKAFLRNIRNAVAQMRMNLPSQNDSHADA